MYLTARFKREKRLIASSIVSEIRAMDPPGRFLARKGGKDQGYWYDIGDEKARDKTSQALRENAPSIRAEIETEINQQREDMKRNDDKKQQTSAEQNISAPPSSSYPPPPPPPPRGYFNPRAYWDYYHHYYYGYPPPPGHPPHNSEPHFTHSPTPPPLPTSTPTPPPQPPPEGAGYHWATPTHASVETDTVGIPTAAPVQVQSQEQVDQRIASALQQQENEAAFEDRKKRRYTEEIQRQSIAFVSPGHKGPMQLDLQMSKVAKVASASPAQGDDHEDANLTQEQKDHRLAVLLQEQEDNALRYEIEVNDHDARRRFSRSNAFPMHGNSNRMSRTNIAWVQNEHSSASSSRNSTSTFEFPGSFMSWTKGIGGPSKDKQAKSVHFDGSIVPPPSTTSREMAYSPLHFQQNQEEAALLPEATGDFLGPMGSWDQSNSISMPMESSGGSSLRVRLHKSVDHTAMTKPSAVDVIITDSKDSGEGQEVELMDFRDESSMPPPQPQAHWSSARVGSGRFKPQPILFGAAKQSSMSSSNGENGISPAQSYDMDGSGTSHLSGIGSVGGGSLCNVFDKEPSPDEIIHRALQQVPSWERSMRSRSPLSISSVDEEGDSMIRFRTAMSEKPYRTMDPIRDDSPANEIDSSMDWE